MHRAAKGRAGRGPTAALVVAMAAAAVSAAAPASADGLRLTEMVLGQTRSRLTLPASAAPVFAPGENIVVDMRNRRLFWRSEELPETVEVYRVAVGRPEAHHPLGRTRVTFKRVEPSWSPTPRARERDPYLPAYVASGGDNPLGSRAINLTWKYYLIHGTNDARKIGRAATWGCVSLYESEVQSLFERIGNGMRVRFEPVVEYGVGHGPDIGIDRGAGPGAGDQS